ncbi:MAG: BamA/TamA family outer membrane protein [Vicinamibacterales bacterium]
MSRRVAMPKGARIRGIWLGAVLGVAALAAACRDPGNIKVTALTFKGNEAVSSKQLDAVLATHASGWLPWSEKQYFDRREFEADLGRIRRFYQDRGYPDVRVTNVEVNLSPKGDTVRLGITIDEGKPLRVEGVELTGFEVLPVALRPQADGLPIKADSPRDRGQVSAARQQVLDLLHDHGFAYGDVQAREDPGTSGGVVLTFAAEPGPATTFGPITVTGLSTLTERVVRRQLSFTPGTPYRRNMLLQSQRRLTALEIIRFVNVDAKPPAGPPVTAIPVTVTIAENPPRRLQLGAGYGTEDRLRASAEWSHLNFFGNARQVSATTKWSSLDRGVRASLTQPYLYHRGLSLEASASSWWTAEQNYTSHSYGGQIGVSYRIGGRRRGASRAPGDTLRAAYVHEFLNYTIKPAALADLGNFNQLIALGLDPITGAGSGTRAAITVDYQRTTADSLSNPKRGYTWTTHGETARPGLGGTFRYNELTTEARAYLPIGKETIIALRTRAGTIAARSDADVPFSQRYFLGGSTNLRGWGRYQVAPLNGGLPVGGRSTVDGTVELRMPLRGGLGGVLFVDSGNVWPRSLSATATGLRSDAGGGLRYGTPVGLIRADVGLQLNQIPGLLVNGKPETRHWRIHFSIGQAF